MDTPADDRTLVLRVRRGYSEDYGELVRRYQASVFNVCYRILRNTQEAEDLSQDAFIRGYQRLDKFDPERPFGPWIRKVAANLAINHIRKNAPVQFPLDEEYDLTSQNPGTNPAAVFEQSERKDKIQAALAALPAHYRAVIELRHFQGMDYEEMAGSLNLPLNTAKSHLYRARKMLADLLKPEE